jgi:hypothetical protein
MNIKAIPTSYKGVNFRSRLEARWAAFFDLCNWPWAYEAVDLNGWIPDFILGQNLDSGIPVEVKPIDFMGLSSAQREQSWQPYNEQLKRAAAAVSDGGGYMLLGTRPFWGGDFYAANPKTSHQLADLGISFFPRYRKYNWAENISRRGSDLQFDFVLEQEPYRGAITGDPFDHSSGLIDQFVTWEGDVLPVWKEASNIVQWKAR